MLWTRSPTKRCFEANCHTQRCSWRLEPRRYPANCGYNDGTGYNSSCPAGTGGTREQVKTRVQGGARAGLLEPHR
eukprot:5309080-Pleurochrysis_carterae.AAC.1